MEFGDGGADDAVIAALKAAASADESPAQRAMLLKRGLIQMVKGQLVINERGYDMMKKAGMPPKLTPEERREEIAGTEEKRLSRFDHRGHREHRVEFARGDYFTKNLSPFAKKSSFADGALLGRGSDRVKGKAKLWLDAHRSLERIAAAVAGGSKTTQEMAEVAEYVKKNPKAARPLYWPWVAGGVAAAGLGYAGHRALKGTESTERG